MKPMHILHTEASCGWGGQEIRILTEAAGMLRRGHRVTLICSHRARIFREAEKRNIPVVDLPVDRKRLSGVLALRRWLRVTPVDVINTHSSTDTWLAALATVWLNRTVPLVRTRHISAPVPKNSLTRWLYTSATAHIVTTGEALRQTLYRENGFPLERISSVPTGIDLTRYVPGDRAAARNRLGLSSDRIIIGIVATLRSWKGHRYLLQAFSRMANRTAHLVIVGDGPQRESLANEISQLKISDRVHLPGNQDDVLPWLHAMDIFALPSYANEGVPQALLQAMACARPVVSTPIGSIQEIITPEVTGLLVQPKDSDDLQRALERLSNDADLRQALGAQARQLVLDRFGLDHMLDKMERIFAGVISNP